MDQLGLVGRRHDDEAGETAEVGDIVRSGVRRPIRPHQPGTIDGEPHRQALDGDVVHHLVVGALQKRRIDRRERLVPLRRQPGREGHRVLLGDADVEGALGKAFGKLVDAGARRHRGRDADDPVVVLGFLDQRVGEHRRIARRSRRRFLLLAGHYVELAHAMVLVARDFRRRIALALLGDDVDEDGPRLLVVAHVLQHRKQMLDVVSVDRTNVEEAQFLEQRAAGHHAAGIFLGAPRRGLDRARKLLCQLPGQVADRAIGLGRDQPRQMRAHRPHRRRDRHVVVVEDDDEARVHRARVVHCLIGHARRHRAIADHRDDPVGASRKIARHAHAERRRDRRRGVRGAERVVLAFGSLGETVQATGLPDRADAVAPPGENLVRIGLVPHVPDQPVARRIENVMQHHGELDDAEPRAEVTPCFRNRIDGFRAQLVGELLQLLDRKPPDIGRLVDRVQKRCPN